MELKRTSLATEPSLAGMLLCSLPNSRMSSSAPAPRPQSRGIAGDEAEPCVTAPFPIPAMASSAPAPPLPPLLFPDADSG
ncbi:uncharacterized protein LOC123446609 [Hordeum vulgare subsp. vulgare]|uniref:Predicted protein n=1 Tax=Hordeum vulgare subsp. vulgare TaxID=112509 RepID=F2EFU4_HORVV|nr:uncharacterized protein LOC123446609 [Hordeum vulgare subsp. vulgare]BAK06216.1 predicted protein [Hordeum vulgare subsp. vulgare]